MLLFEAQKYLEVVRKRGEAGKELRRVYYNIATNKDLYLMAYMNLYANKGAMTPGVAPDDTVDGMSVERIEGIMTKLQQREYNWKPVRRTYRLKRDGKKKRPLGMPGWNDKMVEEVIRLVLEAYYEPQFRESSHGFRPHRGCHTALDAIKNWRGVRWFIEGDIKGCFDGIHHDVVLGILRRNIKDETFLRLLKGMLEAGYVEDWKYHRTYSGTPQGGIVSPLLMNIVLNELDGYAEDELIPEYTNGKRRKGNPAYIRLRDKACEARRKGDWRQAKQLRTQYTKMPSALSDDPEFRRLWYVRYADDTLLGFIGTKAEAEVIKRKLGDAIGRLQLEMSTEKTLITHALTEKARFLNYEINLMHSNSAVAKYRKGNRIMKQRKVNGQLWFSVPKDVIKRWEAIVSKKGKISYRSDLVNRDDYDIISTCEVELQGLINYYNRAHNQQRLRYLRHVWEIAVIKTLATKHRISVAKTYRRYYKRVTVDGRKLICVRISRKGKKPAIAAFGKKKIKREHATVIKDEIQILHITGTELITRLLSEKCELCEKEDIILYAHHIKKLKNLVQQWQGRKEKPGWVKRMIAIRRKTLFVCAECHVAIHAGSYDGRKLT